MRSIRWVERSLSLGFEAPGRMTRVQPAGLFPDEVMVSHVRLFFDGHHIERLVWPTGPMEERIPGFSVLVVHPGPRFPAWTYVSLGCWRATAQDGYGHEFVLSAQDGTARHLEVMTMCAYFHAGPPEQRLELGDTVALGEPWVEGSGCDHVLVCPPYAYGPKLENCGWTGGQMHVLALVPITAAEREFKLRYGAEALEACLEDAQADFANPGRPPVVA